jgi:hypothetical protein
VIAASVTPPRRRQRVGLIAGRSADQRCWAESARPARVSQWIKRRNAPEFWKWRRRPAGGASAPAVSSEFATFTEVERK